MVLKPTPSNPTTDSQSHSPHHPSPSPLPVPNPSKSFWHTEPSSFLLGHKTTAELPSAVDVVIVGSGITGASAARFLLEGQGGTSDGKKVLMLEAREACWGATGRNGGHLQPLLFDRSADIADFELRNCAEVANYIKANKIDCDYRAVSGCRTYWTDGLFAAARDSVHALKKDSPNLASKVQLLTSHDDYDKHRVAHSCNGATLTEGAASLWPYKYVAFVLEKLTKEHGLNLQTNTPVLKLTRASGSDDHEEDHWNVHTTHGTVKARQVILATNGWTSNLLPHLADLLVPVRGIMTALIPPSKSTLLPNSYGFVGCGPGANPNSDDYLIQRPFDDDHGNGYLMFGGGGTSGVLERVGQTDDSVVDEGAVTYLCGNLLKTLQLGGQDGGLEELKAVNAWSGIMCYSRDNAPWVGGVPGMEGVWFAGCYTGHGMPNATLCAKAVVEMVRDVENTSVDAVGAGQRAVERGDIPASYLITEERIKGARELPSVKAQDEQGIVCFSHGT